MKKRRIWLLLLVLLFLLQSTPAYAVNTPYDNQNTETNRVVIAQAEQQGPAYTGQGESHTVTDTRTEEQKQDDVTQDRIDELEELIRDTIGKINSAEQEPGKYPDSDLNPFPDHIVDIGKFDPTFPDIHLPEYELPEYELPEWALPDFELPDLPQWQLPEIDMDKIFEDGEKAFEGVYVIEGENGVLVVDQVTIPIGMMASYISQMNKLNDKTFPQIPQPPKPSLTIEDVEQPPPSPTDISDIIQEIEDWIKDHTPILPPDFDLPGSIDNPQLGDLDDAFNGSITITPLPGTDIDIALPSDVTALYEILMRYLAELQALGKDHINVTRIAHYHVTEYAIRTIRKSTPLAEYRWDVTGASGSVSTQTDTRILKLLFRSAGTYTVRVFNKQQVVRNNKVSGLKSEMWLMGNNDVFNGLVLYNHTTSFEAFLAADIGPTLEEIELVKDGFIANVTPQMINKVQLIDTDGNIRSPSDGHTTERQ